MSVLGGWLLAPVLLMALCLGVGLLVERAAGVRLPGPVVPGVGLAGVIVVAALLTIVDATAELAAPACAVLALLGFVLGRRRLGGGGSLAVAAAAFALLAWPSLASGQASVAGYIKLDDSAIWLGLITHLFEFGRDLSGVPPSTYQLDLQGWLGSGYPVGAFMPVGVTARLSGQDLANVYQPVICVFGAVFALGVYGVARELVRSRALAAGVALVGVQASLFAGYVWWGGVKEVCVAALLPVFVLVARAGSVRALLVVGLVGAAVMDVLGTGGVLWAGAGCLAAAALALRRPLRSYVAAAVGGTMLLVAGSVPVIAVFAANANITTTGVLVGEEDLGKLYAPLSLLQGAGLWPAGDFRDVPDPRWLAVALAVLGLVAAVGAVVVGVRRRAWGMPALLLVTMVGAAPALVVGGSWVDAKVLSITSAVLLSGTAALVAVGLERFRLRAAPAAVLLVAGCAASTWLSVREVYVAPREALAELRDLGERVDGEGPLLMLLYEGYATRYALYRGEVEGASDLRVSEIPSRSGEAFPSFSTVEVDDVDTKALFAFPLLSRRLTPVGSRPPGAYAPFAEGEFFETWQRRGDPPVEHLSLGGGLAPAAQVTCSRLRTLARRGSTLAAVPRENPVLSDLTAARLPAGWKATVNVQPTADGTARATVTVPEAGEWRVWVGGATLGELEVSLGGRSVGSLRHQLDASIGWMRFGTAALPAGEHEVTLRTSRSWWQAGRGSDAAQLPLGPIALTREGEEPAVERVPSAQVDRLCDGRTYDWVEALA